MIKDGKSVIGPTLRAAMPHMDAWLIFDTGSTDGTQKYITALMKKEFPHKPGKIVEEPFVNFEVSRTRALEVARAEFPHVTFQMMLDDSYILHGGEVLRAFLKLKSTATNDDGYMITIGTPISAMQYNSTRIFRTSEPVAYEGVVHEVPTCSAEEIVPRQAYIEDGRSDETAERSRKRFHRDLALLLPEVKARRGNYTRNLFYLAQTYECLEKFQKAMEWYKKRTEAQGGFLEEVYMAFFRMGRIWHKRMNRDWETAQHYYLQGHGINPRRWECPYKLAKYYYQHQDEPGAWNLCHSFAHMAVENSEGRHEPGEYDLFAVANIYTLKMPNVYCMSAWYCNDVDGRHHDKARELLMQCIRHFPEWESPQNQIAFFNNRLKNLNADKHYAYPAKIVGRLAKNAHAIEEAGKEKEKEKIVVTMTTCKRFDLFTRTLNSFLTCCSDLDRVHRWLVVDDNSSEEDRQRMAKLYPFLEFIFKTPDQRGHAKSMNMLRAALADVDDVTHVFHMEDDWLFLDRKPYFSLLLDVLQHEPECGQALVNRNYAERLHDDTVRIVGGFHRATRHEVKYVLHQHIETETKEYNRLMSTLVATQGSHAYWPHYSLRPGLLRTAVWKELGGYDEEHRHFEMEYANRYTAAGFKTAFLDGIFSLHIGKLTSETDSDVASAYKLNETERF